MHVSLPTSTNSACNTSGCSFLCSIDLISTLSLRPNLFFFSTPLFSAVTSWPWHDHGRTRKNSENIPCLCEVDNVLYLKSLMSCRNEQSASALLTEEDVATSPKLALTKTGSQRFTASTCNRMMERLTSTDEKPLETAHLPAPCSRSQYL